MADGTTPKHIKKFNFSIGIIILILIFVGVSVGTSFFTVDATEQAVITRFGKYYTTMSSGLHFKIPFGIDHCYIVSTKPVQEQFGFSSVQQGKTTASKTVVPNESIMLTGDLNIVNVEWIIQYKILDPAAWLFNVQEKTQTIRDISQSVVNTLVGDQAILDVMGSARSEIEKKAKALMNENFESLGLGIVVNTVNFQDIVAPEGVQAAFEDVNKASQDMERYINEGRTAYNSQKPLAEGEAEQTIKQAQGYASERVNQAKGDVARFNSVYKEYEKAPAITKERIYLETMQQIYTANKNTTLIDTNLQNIIPLNNVPANTNTKDLTETTSNQVSSSETTTGDKN